MRLSHHAAVCAFVATLTGLSTVQAAPSRIVDSTGETALQVFHHLQDLVQWKVAHLDAISPNLIDPCWLVDVQFWNEANPQKYQFHIIVQYTSGNKTVKRTIRVPMSVAFVETPKHVTFDTAKWIQVTTAGIDVSGKLPDPNTAITGKVRLERIDDHDDDDDGDGDGHHHHDHDHDCSADDNSGAGA